MNTDFWCTTWMKKNIDNITLRRIARMTDEQRLELLGTLCRNCGRLLMPDEQCNCARCE